MTRLTLPAADATVTAGTDEHIDWTSMVQLMTTTSAHLQVPE